MNIKINKKRFKKNYLLAKKIYNTCVVLNCFCKEYQFIEEIANILPMVEYLNNESDKLCYDFLNISLGLDENGNKIKL